MTITFEIPNGTMVLNLDQFLPEAKISQIRKAIKLIPDDQKQEMATWLKDQPDVLAQKTLNYFMLHREEESRISGMKLQVELLKHHQEDKEQLNEAKMRLSRCRRLSTQYRRKSEEISKLKKRYEELIRKLE
ncbi:MAG: hypothetical protein ACRDBO_14440 [Lachnospiraceae bacterium]